MNGYPDNSRNRWVLLLSVALFVVACALPALILHIRQDIDGTHQVWGSYRNIRGIELLLQGLLLGWIRFNFTAFANPLLWIAWGLYLFERYEGARIFSTLALVISAETLQLCVQPYLYDEAGVTKGFLVAPHIGFVCWIASMLVIWFDSNRWLRIEDCAEASTPLSS